MTVAVVEAATKKSIEFNDKDFKVEWYSGTGCGGQFRNKHQNSCRIFYLPTGQVATAQCRSRENSFEEAKTDILRRLSSASTSKANQDLATIRKDQIGSGMRGDKNRTYRFQDDTAKDHETGKQARLSKVLAGNFDLLW